MENISIQKFCALTAQCNCTGQIAGILAAEVSVPQHVLHVTLAHVSRMLDDQAAAGSGTNCKLHMCTVYVYCIPVLVLPVDCNQRASDAGWQGG